MSQQKPVIGISCGDLNGIGIELIIKSLSDSRIFDICTIVIFSSAKALNFYKKNLPDYNFSYQSIRDFNKLALKQANLFTCWEEEVNIIPGQLTDEAGKYAVISLLAAADALKQNHIQGLVTAPIHKKNTQSQNFNFTGHTPFLKDFFAVQDVAMMMCANSLRVALLTEHLPVNEVTTFVTKANILNKLSVIHKSLQQDFGISKPRIAVLGLNPHAGDEGLIGTQENEIIKPAIKEAKTNHQLVIGPFSADAFFARGHHEKFDAVLAMYHDQGLIPFKTLAADEGINFTAGLPSVRTSPDHGVAFDIAGKGKAEFNSFLTSIFECVDIINRRKQYEEDRRNPLTKVTATLLANATDERIEE